MPPADPTDVPAFKINTQRRVSVLVHKSVLSNRRAIEHHRYIRFDFLELLLIYDIGEYVKTVAVVSVNDLRIKTTIGGKTDWTPIVEIKGASCAFFTVGNHLSLSCAVVNDRHLY